MWLEIPAVDILFQWGMLSGSHCCPNSKVYGANMGPIWARQDPGGPNVGPMNLVIWLVALSMWHPHTSQVTAIHLNITRSLNLRVPDLQISCSYSVIGHQGSSPNNCHQADMPLWSIKISRPDKMCYHLLNSSLELSLNPVGPAEWFRYHNRCWMGNDWNSVGSMLSVAI